MAASAASIRRMKGPTVEELLDAWRDAVRAADLAERMAAAATETLHEADLRADVSAEIADLAEQAAEAASRAALRARTTALEAAAAAQRLREQKVPDSHAKAATSRQLETEAGALYREAKGRARPGP